MRKQRGEAEIGLGLTFVLVLTAIMAAGVASKVIGTYGEIHSPENRVFCKEGVMMSLLPDGTAKQAIGATGKTRQKQRGVLR